VHQRGGLCCCALFRLALLFVDRVADGVSTRYFSGSASNNLAVFRGAVVVRVRVASRHGNRQGVFGAAAELPAQQATESVRTAHASDVL